MKKLCILTAILFVVSGTRALQQEIPLDNAGFEAPGMGKIYTFDYGWYDVPGWNDVDWNNDCGVEGPYPWWSVHSGYYAAFFMGWGDPGAYQITGHTIRAGDVFTVGFWAKNIDSATSLTVSLFGDTLYVPANEMGSYIATGLTGGYKYYETTIAAPIAAVGQTLGIKFTNTGSGWVGLDDVSIVVEIPPIILVSVSPEGTGVTNQPVLEAVIADGESQVDPGSILLSLDDNPLTPNITKSGSLTTVSYAVPEPLEALSTHTVRLVVAGMNPPSEPITNDWSLVVIGSGEPRRVYVDATDGPTGNTTAWNPMTSMFEEWNLPVPWGDDYDWRWDMWDWLGNSNSAYWSSVYEDAPRLKTTATGMANGAYKVYAYFWSFDPFVEAWGIMYDIQAALNNRTVRPYDGASEGVVRHYLDIDPDDSYDYIAPVYSSSMSWNPFTGDVKIADGDLRLFEIPLGTVTVINGELSVYIDDIYLKYENAWWGLSLYDGIGYEPLTVDPDTFITGGGWVWSPPGALTKKYEFTDSPPAETTIAHWDFADPGAVDGAFMPGNAELEDLDMDGAYDDDDFRISARDLTGNGNHLTTPISYWMKWNDDSIQGDFSMQNGNFLPDAHTHSWFNPYLTGIDIESITPAQWTIEAVFKLEELAPFCTIVGRDGYFLGINPFGALATLYFSTRGSDLAIEYIDVGGFDHNLQIAANLKADTWYRAAAVSDGTTLSLYLNGELIGSQDLTIYGTDTSLAMGWGTWSVARGMWDGEHTDRVFGLIDEVAISDAALTPETFVIQSYEPVLEGRANVGFSAKYTRGAAYPTGQAEFQFRAGGLNFHSSNYEWLLISGAEAVFKGSGTINHVSGFGFMLTATDGDMLGKGMADRVRIQIWDKLTGDIIYDNKSETTLRGGNIEIHTRHQTQVARDSDQEPESRKQKAKKK